MTNQTIVNLTEEIEKKENELESLKTQKELEIKAIEVKLKREKMKEKPYRVLLFKRHATKTSAIGFKTEKGMLRRFDTLSEKGLYHNTDIIHIQCYKYADNPEGMDTGPVQRLDYRFLFKNTNLDKQILSHMNRYIQNGEPVFHFGENGAFLFESFMDFITSDSTDYTKNAKDAMPPIEFAKEFIRYHELDIASNEALLNDVAELIDLLDKNLGRREQLLNKGFSFSNYTVTYVNDTLRFRKV